MPRKPPFYDPLSLPLFIFEIKIVALTYTVDQISLVEGLVALFPLMLMGIFALLSAGGAIPSLSALRSMSANLSLLFLPLSFQRRSLLHSPIAFSDKPISRPIYTAANNGYKLISGKTLFRQNQGPNFNLRVTMRKVIPRNSV